ncbi:uncharacterized protein K452DRAFT_312416 [Aplosporella prunicola CBS 121167]|uniref:Uncharacterized protein n=1 Tax=Aplosporella prunicola CBS 121167 TaxID=1176127 RepID=A0A6A6B336_9PEZI|nr:uncharacterized protein K452DRAFT_312416 [Aplosporella prunicola CBS 121167]KAF2137417.1 hypothetical protein K452DRAFT_312416 [Aplosporella prunicola CBS 121167]
MAFYTGLQLHHSSQRAIHALCDGEPSLLTSSVSEAEERQIPAPEIFSSLGSSKTYSESLVWPKVSECAVHLELLHALYHLRQRIQLSPINFAGKTTNDEKQLESIMKKRWAIYSLFSVIRLLRWIETDATPPPLDILMVWQACLLNPAHFAVLCKTLRRESFRSIRFPWVTVHASIDPNDWTFRLPEEEKTNFTSNSKLHSDLLELLLAENPTQALCEIEYCTLGSNGRSQNPTATQSTTNKPVGDIIEDALNQAVQFFKNKKVVNEILAAIERQYSFITKMEQHLWIRSPALEGTLRRAIDRYQKFTHLLKTYPGTMLVPTLDIDLVWHTHQCSSAQYQSDMEKLTGKFIDHNDKLGAPVLKGGEDRTRELFYLRFGREYLLCFCWDCEAVLSEVERLKGQKMDKERRRDAARRTAILVSYYRAVELARQRGKPGFLMYGSSSEAAAA